MAPTDICNCGCSLRSHFESTDDGSGCIQCPDCEHFQKAEVIE